MKQTYRSMFAKVNGGNRDQRMTQSWREHCCSPGPASPKMTWGIHTPLFMWGMLMQRETWLYRGPRATPGRRPWGGNFKNRWLFHNLLLWQSGKSQSPTHGRVSSHCADLCSWFPTEDSQYSPWEFSLKKANTGIPHVMLSIFCGLSEYSTPGHQW